MTMDRCQEYQTQMLDYVYDLLDADETERLRNHLDVCPQCRVALLDARSQQQLLAAAARLEFPAVHFTAPAPEPVAPPAPVVLPLPLPSAPRRSRVAWRRWAAAAALLLALGIPSALGLDYLDARRELGRHETAVARLRQEQEQLNQKAIRLEEKRVERLSERTEAVLKNQRHVTLSGNASFQDGGTNKYRVDMHDGLNNPVAGKIVSARVIDSRRNRVVYEKTDFDAGADSITLPKHLDADPYSPLKLEVKAVGTDGQTSVLQEGFLLTPPTYLTHLMTDKPLYQPGETVRFRSLTLERFSLKPAEEHLAIRYSLTTPQGSVLEIPQGNWLKLAEDGTAQGAAVYGPENRWLRGIGGGEWDVQANSPGGEYILTVSEDQNRFPPQQRKFLVNNFKKPRLLKEMFFTKRSYGAGEEVLATCKVEKGKDQPLAHCKVSASVQIDGKTYDAKGKESKQGFELKTDAKGEVLVRFRLPAEIDRGLASVNVSFHDGGTPEPLLKPIPIVLDKLDVDFYPEGGYLVPRVPTRVYFQARTKLGKPAELKGRLMDDTGDVVALVQTLADDREPGVNQGVGVFRFKPNPNRKYHLELDRPAGITENYELKTERWGQVALSIPRAVTTSHEPLEVHLRSIEKTRQLFVGAYCRGRLFDHQRITAPAGEDVTVTLRPAHGVGGVYRVTVFEEEDIGGQHPRLTPRAERLVFRQQRERLNLDVALGKNNNTVVASSVSEEKKNEAGEGKAHRELEKKLAGLPGQRVTLGLTARGENQEPVPAVVVVDVVDQSLLKLADEKTARSMPTHFFLTSEVRKPEELEYADFLLTNHPKAGQALDLLLGTQGWRRFAEQQPGEVRERLQAEADALAAILPSTSEVPRVTKDQADKDQKRSLDAQLLAEAEKIDREITQQRRPLEARMSEIQAEGRALAADPETVRVAARVQRYTAVLALVDRLTPLFLLVFVLAGCLLAGKALGAARRRAVPYAVAAIGCVGACVVLALHWGFHEPRAEVAPSVVPTESLARAGDNALGAEFADDITPAAKADRQSERPAKEAESVPPTSPVRPEVSKQDSPRSDPAAPRLPMLGGFGITGGGPHPMTAPGGGFPRKPGESKGGAGGFGKASDDRAHGWDSVQMRGAGLKKRTDVPGEAQLELFRNLDLDDADKKALLHAAPKFADSRTNRNYTRAVREQSAQAQSRRDTKDAGKDGKERDLTTAAYFVREYAHQRQTPPPDKNQNQSFRSDDTDTVYWHPALVLPDGKIDISFALSDAVTTYQVTVYGHTLDGRIAAAKPFTFDARPPLALDSVTPHEVAASDRVIAPVTVTNSTGDSSDVTLRLKEVTGLKRLDEAEKKPADAEVFSLKGRSAGRRLLEFQPSVQHGYGGFQVEGQASTYTDRLERKFAIVPEGFPVVEARSDLLEGGEARQSVTMPAREKWVKGSLQIRLQAFPSTLADLQQGLEGLLREPSGCFEQASTTNYPNVLILGYLKESDQAKPELERRVRELMEQGYRKLTSYECEKPASSVSSLAAEGRAKGKREGYEWFGGQAPPHEALTAYGLLQFRDMARYYPVDRDMLERTRKYLLSRRDGKGGFERNPKVLGHFGMAPEQITNAYIVWALSESSPSDDLKREMDALTEQAKTSKDPYFLALVANSLINRAKTADAIPLLKTVKGLQKDEGFVAGAQTSITGSGGRDLDIETTALAMLGWVRADPGQFGEAIDRAVKWISKQRGGYGAFGSTQSTILALKALIAHTKQTKRPREDGVLRMWVNGQLAGEQALTAQTAEALVINMPQPEGFVKEGKNEIRITVTGKNQFPYTLTWTYRTQTPSSDDASVVKLATKLDRTKAGESESVRLTVNVENTTDRGQGMAVAVIGLPGGLSLPEDLKQLKHYKELPKDGSAPLVSTFEIRGRELILYWRDLAPRQKITVPIDLSCRVPGEYSGPASRAYLYYNSDHKTWVEPLRIRIDPKE
jgi:hypothetical protein